jgi:hypothetical protein
VNNDLENLLKNAIEKTGIPREELEKLIRADSKKGELPKFMNLANIRFASELIDEIKDELKNDLTQSRDDFQNTVNDTFRIILYNLVRCSLTRESLSLPGSNKAYNTGTPFNKLKFTKNSVDVCLKALKPYLQITPGNTYKKEVNSYFPNKEFQLKLIPLIYSVYEEYNDDTELIIIQDKNNKDYEKLIYTKKDLENNNNKHIMWRTSSIILERTYQKDLEQLVKINDALKDATYALKAPIKRIYSRGDVNIGGRLYTPLANLPDKRARIRINTLFNGNPVAEVDLKANHPSMLYAMFYKKQLPKDYYQMIANESGVSRDKVKWLILKMVGADDGRLSTKTKINEKDYSKSKSKMSEKEKKAIQNAAEKLFPDLYLHYYQDMGVVMQAMEGDILLDAMCDLLEKGILSLPIYDALYVQQPHIKEAEKALKDAWKKNIDVHFEPFLDIDFP